MDESLSHKQSIVLPSYGSLLHLLFHFFLVFHNHLIHTFLCYQPVLVCFLFYNYFHEQLSQCLLTTWDLNIQSFMQLSETFFELLSRVPDTVIVYKDTVVNKKSCSYTYICICVGVHIDNTQIKTCRKIYNITIKKVKGRLEVGDGRWILL